MVKPKLLDQVRDAKGQKDRVTMLPLVAKDPLRTYLAKVKAIHEKDLVAGFGKVQLPFALKKKYPNADREWAWQFVKTYSHIPSL
jgi:hypothetical protein